MQQVTRTEIIKIQAKGLITIPKKLRQKLGLEANDLIRIIEEKGKLVMEPLRALPYPIRSYTKQEFEEFIELDRVETKKLKQKGLL